MSYASELLRAFLTCLGGKLRRKKKRKLHLKNTDIICMILGCTDLLKEHSFCTGAVFADVMVMDAVVFPNYFRFFLKDYQKTINSNMGKPRNTTPQAT